MKFFSLVFLLLAGSWALPACGSYAGLDAHNMSSEKSDYLDGLVTRGLATKGRVPASENAESDAASYPVEAGPSSVVKERKVVYTAEYSLRTSNLTVALARAKALAKEMGGWVQEEGSGRFAFRVPADKFWETTEKIPEIGRVLNHTIKSRDVTEQYTDLGIRLKVRKRFLAELQELYDKGGSLQDLLAVKKEIDRVTEEIERLEGKIRFLQEQIDWSTIRLSFQVQSEYVSRDFNLPFRWLQSLGIQTLLSAR